MIKRLSSFLLVLLVLTPTLAARVISYAPYTDQVAIRGYHLRTTRYFVLAEAPANQVFEPELNGRLVLYDATGAEEPRVIYPAQGSAIIRFAALYQAHPSAQPIILANLRENGLYLTRISTDGGRNWKQIPELNGRSSHRDTDVDLGGPWTRGNAVPVRLGTPTVPFVVGYGGAVYAIAAAGTAKQLATTEWGSNTLLGQNQNGTQFLIRTTSTTVMIADADGNRTTLAGDLDPQSQYSGWLTRDNAVYLLRHRIDGRFLYLYRNGTKSLVAGPYEAPDPGLAPPMTQRNTMSFFAVPTYDFDGAWMIQRDPGKPTTLLLHKPGLALAKMWSDVSGPEVEALHAGSSAERLLIQVHREREVVEVPFVDPALAIWKMGEAAPRNYDELFLNEAITKGFVHVDVETMAAGAPFVFDSGFARTNVPPDIVVSPPISGGGDVIQEWGVVRASLKQQLVLPGVARLPGAFNSFWLTDVVVYNPLDVPQDVNVHYVPMGEELRIATASTVKLTLAAKEIRVVNDALKSLFNIDNGGGALYFMPAVGVNVTGRTYSRAAGGNGGTFGYGTLAIDFFNAAGPRFPVSFSGAFPGPNYRTNILLTDTSGRGTEARLQAYGVSGTIGASDIAISTPNSGVVQANGIGGMLGLFSHQSGGLVVQPTRGTAIPTVVAIDNRTNDPTYFPPDLPASVVRTIPVIGHLDGAHGSRFRSDVYLLNLSPSTRTVSLEVKSWDNNQWPQTLRFTLLPNEARVIEDALFKLFGMTGVARLRYWSDGPAGDATGVRVTSRTYNIDANGGTFGCLIPPLNNFQSATAGEALEIVGIVGGSGFRTNIGLVELSQNPNGQTTSVRLMLIDEKGKTLDTFTVSLPVAGGMQINDVFAARGVATPNAARVIVQVLDARGLVGAYATLTDNITNDSTFLGAQLAATPE